MSSGFINSRAKKLGAAAAVVTVFAGTGVAVAGAAQHHHASTNTINSSRHEGGHRSAHAPGGEVSAISANALTIQDPSGASATFAINTNTVFLKAGVSASASDVSVGSFIRIVPTTPGSMTALKVFIQGPHVGGKVTAIDGSTITLTNRNGTTLTVIESGATTYTKDGVAASSSDVLVGQRVEARGTFVTGSTTTLNATTVKIGSPGPGHEPVDGPGHGPGHESVDGPGHGPGDDAGQDLGPIGPDHIHGGFGGPPPRGN